MKEEKGQGSSSLAAKLLESGKGKGDQSVDEDFVAKATSLIYAGKWHTTFMRARTLSRPTVDHVAGADTVRSTSISVSRFIVLTLSHADCFRPPNIHFSHDTLSRGPEACSGRA